MYHTGTQPVQDDQETDRGDESKAAKVSSSGIRTTTDLIDLEVAVIDDILHGRLGPKRGNTVNNGVSNILRTIDTEGGGRSGRTPIPLRPNK